MNSFYFAHAFGARYELPIPLLLFVVGGAAVVFLSFLVVLPRKVVSAKAAKQTDDSPVLQPVSLTLAAISFTLLALLVVAGITGTQEVAENILPTVFWLLVWVALPLSCGVLGNWTQRLNPFANIAKITDSAQLRGRILSRSTALTWPARLGWWPVVALYAMLAIGELIFNEFATRPLVIGLGLLMYFVISATMGLLYGADWLKRGEVFTSLFDTWGRLGYFRFGNKGSRGFAGGLNTSFATQPSRVVFVLLLLVSVSFDGLLSTPSWIRAQQQLPESIHAGSLALQLLTTLSFGLLLAITFGVFMLFARAVSVAAGRTASSLTSLAGLLPSLLPISFGYLLAHNLEYLVVNSQLLFPLIGNPIGKESWPLHLAYPFNDDYEPKIHLLPSSAYWYIAVAVIIAVHIYAVVLAHRHLAGGAVKNNKHARQSEYPWVFAMVAYTMLSLWLLAQPLTEEHTHTGYIPAKAESIAYVVGRE